MQVCTSHQKAYSSTDGRRRRRSFVCGHYSETRCGDVLIQHVAGELHVLHGPVRCRWCCQLAASLHVWRDAESIRSADVCSWRGYGRLQRPGDSVRHSSGPRMECSSPSLQTWAGLRNRHEAPYLLFWRNIGFHGSMLRRRCCRCPGTAAVM